ncbi:hypothetical protein AMS68_002534 [Peltaster fructicola]|uniref:HhH-GPD domain-containing protein n=1 Tax=Peltaster fructicola TaxID=286661 RepID=A0A6H0XQI3_9PEZI|nr:hypothetical protein AMS68_002534 [Peltaster fructicola]
MSLRRSSRNTAPAIAAAPTANGVIAPKSASKRTSSKHEAPSDHPNETNGVVKQDSSAMPPPVTPVKRRRLAKDDVKPPPITPTPSAIGVMLDQGRPNRNHGSAAVDDTVSPSNMPRPVDTHHTNAPLVTPSGTQVHPMDRPSGIGATTSTVLRDACNHLITVDPNLKTLVNGHHCRVFSGEGLAEKIDPFEALVSGILSQQVSGAAARSIKNKFIALYQPEQCLDGFPTPSSVAADEIARLRTAGLSQRKAEYVQGLAQKFASKELTVEMLLNGSDEEVMEKLVAVRGLGAWSVQMFMCFGLKRMDIFSTGDLGVQRGMAVYVGKDVAKLKNKGGKWKYMSEQDMISTSEPFKPYRSLFMWYMWRIEDVITDALEG